MLDAFETVVTIAAARSRVWQALTDVTQFNTWFKCRLTDPFVAGGASQGKSAEPGYEQIDMTIWIEAIDPEHLFAFRWHPHAVDSAIDYSGEPTTLVEFLLAAEGERTRLTIRESGFDAIPAHRRALAFTSNQGGWTEQAKRIRAFVEG